MAVLQEQIEALAEAVAMWRLQEYIFIAFNCFYVYYVLITTDEEVSIIYPQRWNRGKALYIVIRYGVILNIALDFSANYRTYYIIAPAACKAMVVIYHIAGAIVILICDFSLGLCLAALLQVKSLYVIAILILSCGAPGVTVILDAVGIMQYPAESTSALDTELGYPCYDTSAIQFAEKTVAYVGRDIRAYFSLTTTILLAILGVATVIIRYKGQSGRLMQVIRQDGGLHYLSLLAIRLCSAMLFTPVIVSLSDVDANPVFTIAGSAAVIMVPVLAQRLLINMRKVDYMGSQPVASKLLFAPPPAGSEADLEDYVDSGPPSVARLPSALRSASAEDKVPEALSDEEAVVKS